MDEFVRVTRLEPHAYGGHHNQNRVAPVPEAAADRLRVTPGTLVMVRTPRDDTLPVVVRTWPDEGKVLEALADLVPNTPKLLARSGASLVCSYTEGVSLATVSPVGTKVEARVIRELTERMARLTSVNPDVLPSRPDGMPLEEDDSQAYLQWLALQVEEQVKQPNWTVFGPLFESLNVPHDVMLDYAGRVPKLSRRPYTLLHLDLHRDNVIIPFAGEQLVCVDWELAGYGDPVHDLAVHLVRMRYPRRQWLHVATVWARHVRQVGNPMAAYGMFRDLRHYVAFEQAQSVFPDVMRAAQSLGDRFDQRDLSMAAAKIHRALRVGARPLRLLGVPDQEEIRAVLSSWRISRGGRPVDSRSVDSVHWPQPGTTSGRSGPSRDDAHEALDGERQAAADSVFRGTTHINTLVRLTSGRSVMVRRKLDRTVAPGRPFLPGHNILVPESDILLSLENSGAEVCAPRVLALGDTGVKGAYAVHSYVGPENHEGRPDHPVHGLLPNEADALVAQLQALTDPRVLDAVARQRRISYGLLAGAADFYLRLSEELANMVVGLSPATLQLAEQLGLPDAMTLREILGRRQVTARAPVLLHADLNPWNIVRRPKDTEHPLALVDWERAIVGDGLYDLVRHMHLTPTRPETRERLFQGWVRALHPQYTRGWQEDEQTYRTLETVRSAYFDLDRMVSRSHLDAPNVSRAVDSYAVTLEEAKAQLGVPSREVGVPSLLLAALPHGCRDSAAWAPWRLRFRDRSADLRSPAATASSAAP
ncbi:aminoglycoside phosphotransferase family protein [Streptomyces canus]|uniref:aminoglycoside phosphotransferase family protein n=1 Tax=Streptomyces canus TaxID=58343 RepID=UPI002E27C62A|nr:aminoglycoside phosphotransferase family protein [Streptomyces canus]